MRPRPHRGDFFDPLGVCTLTLPPTAPPHGRWAVSRFSVEPFIVFRSDVMMFGALFDLRGNVWQR
jgi:hypothetical protein